MEFEKLETRKLLIRQLTDKDTPTIFRLSQEKSLGEWMPDQVYRDEAQTANVIEFLKSQYKPFPDPTRRPFVLGIVACENPCSGRVLEKAGFFLESE